MLVLCIKVNVSEQKKLQDVIDGEEKSVVLWVRRKQQRSGASESSCRSEWTLMTATSSSKGPTLPDSPENR
jgi:hypothetical protein